MSIVHPRDQSAVTARGADAALPEYRQRPAPICRAAACARSWPRHVARAARAQDRAAAAASVAPVVVDVVDHEHRAGPRSRPSPCSAGPARRSSSGAAGLRRPVVALQQALGRDAELGRRPHARAAHRGRCRGRATRRARGHPRDDVERTGAARATLARARAASQRTATRSLRYFTRATSSRATPSYANTATDHATPGIGGAGRRGAHRRRAHASHTGSRPPPAARALRPAAAARAGRPPASQHPATLRTTGETVSRRRFGLRVATERRSCGRRARLTSRGDRGSEDGAGRDDATASTSDRWPS